MGRQHAGRGFLTCLVLTVRPAPLRYIQQVISLKPNSVALILIFRGLTAVGGGNLLRQEHEPITAVKKKKKKKDCKASIQITALLTLPEKIIIIRILSHFLTSAF